MNPAMQKILNYDNTCQIFDCILIPTTSYIGYIWTATPEGALLAASPFITKAFERAITATLIEKQALTDLRSVAILSIAISTTLALITGVAIFSIFGIELTAFNLSIFLLYNLLPCYVDTVLSLIFSKYTEEISNHTQIEKRVKKDIDQLEDYFKQMVKISGFSQDAQKKATIDKVFTALSDYRRQKSKKDRINALSRCKRFASFNFHPDKTKHLTLPQKKISEIDSLYGKFLKTLPELIKIEETSQNNHRDRTTPPTPTSIPAKIDDLD